MAPSGKFNFRHPSPVIENQWNIKMSTPYKITLDQMPEQIRHNKLKTESKKLKNIIVVLSYRGECAIKNIIAPV
ncbi:MAG: hypothetical protein KA341_04995 [Saprospiraceae bacterium]|nr:hypothetical protein [Saprospiraceae bacterium]